MGIVREIKNTIYHVPILEVEQAKVVTKMTLYYINHSRHKHRHKETFCLKSEWCCFIDSRTLNVAMVMTNTNVEIDIDSLEVRVKGQKIEHH